MELEPIIGLEIHVQLSTASKMFCSCDNRGEFLPPNTAVCAICLGHPGTLPTPNERAVRNAILLGCALQCALAPRLKFDRKHYFYPDLPKGYQITQYDEPICGSGSYALTVPGTTVPRAHVTVHIERAHLEEDAAKSFHDTSGTTLVDFNRGGSPLVEIVTRPCFQTPLEAKTFLQELRLLVRTLGISDGDMEKGHMRCDANISLRPVGTKTLYPKTEVKNLNSFKSVERALMFEIERQTQVWHETGAAPAETTTRGWNDVAQKTVPQRTKEAAHDYRYFPEPDIPPFDLAHLIAEILPTVPELPNEKRARFMHEHGFAAPDARQFVEDADLGAFAEHVMTELRAAIADTAPETADEEIKPRAAKLIAGWILSKYVGALREAGKIFTPETVSPKNFAELLVLLYTAKINSTSAQTLLKKMIASGAGPEHLLSESGTRDAATPLAELVAGVIAEFPEQVAQYRAGKKNILQFLVGAVMKKSRGHGDAEDAAELLQDALE